MDISLDQTGESLRITLNGQIDERGSDELKNHLSELDPTVLKDVTFDFSGVNRIGSSGIGRLLLFYKNLSVSGGSMRVENLSPNLFELFQSLKLDTLFPVTHT
jgi:anti-sigma B factor antagonist